MRMVQAPQAWKWTVFIGGNRPSDLNGGDIQILMPKMRTSAIWQRKVGGFFGLFAAARNCVLGPIARGLA